ncbi:putative membrane protein [Luteitalea pratensis]|uniref:Putative membrane protein n=1 Tax=Luteitalea pratensis TaxID=1855912 RepID=A0A143PSH0_LUTPR|nr:putative membrane protein [Luteitalea pratensis]
MPTSVVRSPPPPASPPVAETSLGLSRKRAAILAYSAGWVTGLLVLWLEGQDRDTRWHAAQSVLGFGALTVLGCACLGVAALGILSSLTVFRAGLWAAQGVVLIGVLLWLWSMVQVALGGTPRWPLIGARVERLAVPS